MVPFRLHKLTYVILYSVDVFLSYVLWYSLPSNSCDNNFGCGHKRLRGKWLKWLKLAKMAHMTPSDVT